MRWSALLASWAASVERLAAIEHKEATYSPCEAAWGEVQVALHGLCMCAERPHGDCPDTARVRNIHTSLG